MLDKEMKSYIVELLKKYDYYNPVKDRNEILELAKIKNMDILEIGSDRGELAVLAAKRFNCKVIIVDSSKTKIKIAKENAKKEDVTKKIRFVLDDATKLNFIDNSFDSVVSYLILRNAGHNYPKIVKEMFRVAKNKVIIAELNKKGMKAFDEYIHPNKNKTIIDLQDLESILSKYSKFKSYSRKLIKTFVCYKEI